MNRTSAKSARLDNKSLYIYSDVEQQNTIMRIESTCDNSIDEASAVFNGNKSISPLKSLISACYESPMTYGESDERRSAHSNDTSTNKKIEKGVPSALPHKIDDIETLVKTLRERLVNSQQPFLVPSVYEHSSSAL